MTGENNQLLSDGTYNYEYDQEGNRVRRTEIATGEVTEYEWDYRNRLVAVETENSDGNVVANSDYTYDVFDRRIAKSVDADGDGVGEAVVERYVHDGDHIALTFDGEGNQTERFLHGLQVDQVLAQENTGGEVLWALADNQGSVRMVLDNDGNVVNEITYDAFGNITVESNPDVNFRFSYTGRELDDETGLYNYRTRYYDPAVGQFINEDTIGFAGGDSNLYRYVVNNPVNYTDPYGEDLYDVLNTADKFAAGFADTVTLGLSTKFRESAYGDLATRNHKGGVFNAGRVTGGVVALATGFNTPGNFAAGLSWAQKAAIGYEVAATGYGAYDATSKFLEGCATPWDALNFLPLAGYGLGRLRGLNNVDDAGRALNQASNAVGDADDLFRQAGDGFDDVPPLGGRGPTPIDPNDGMFQFGSHLGESSSRPFNPDKIGLPISPRQLSSDKVKITEKGIEKVEQHLDKFQFDPQNQAQLQRFRDIAAEKIEVTEIDLNTYTHELRESLRYKKLGYESGEPKNRDLAYEVWNNTHTATLEDYGLSAKDIYHPSTE